jgi:flagella basal body P-ring formation protein FlgA
MKRGSAVIMMSLTILFAWLATAAAKVELNVAMTLKLTESPRDTVMSLNGRYIYILTEKGEILVYTSNGRLKDTVSVDTHVESIEAGPREDVLLLTNGKEKTVQVITLDLIQDIDISGSPFRGNADAPVVVAVFSDFE